MSANGHTFVNIGYNHFICKRCELDSYQAEGTGPCQGHRVWACPSQGNWHTHGECLQLFATSKEADRHWMTEHYPDLVKRGELAPAKV